MEKTIHRSKLSNGLELFLIEKKSIPMTTVLFVARNGSFVETQANNGLAHLYEHMFFKANEKIASQEKFMEVLDDLGIELGPNMNAYTSTESVRYFFTIQSQFLKGGLQLMADAILTPAFLQEELEKERKVVIGEFDRYEASPSDVFFQRSLMSKLFQDHFVRKNVIGQRAVILNATQAQMHEFQHRYYIPNNSALFIVGDFEIEETRRELERLFGSWPMGPDPFKTYPVPEHPPLKEDVTFIEKASVRTVNVVRAFHGPKLTLDDKDTRALDIISSLLSFQASPFQKELVEAGLSSHAAFFSWTQRYTSPMIFSIETSPEKARAAVKKFNEVIERLKKPGFFTEDDLRIAINAVEVSSTYDRESGQRYALALASVWSSSGDIDYYTSYVDEVKKLTLQDIEAVFSKYLSGRSVTAALVPQDSPQSPNALKVEDLQRQ